MTWSILVFQKKNFPTSTCSLISFSAKGAARTYQRHFSSRSRMCVRWAMTWIDDDYDTGLAMFLTAERKRIQTVYLMKLNRNWIARFFSSSKEKRADFNNFYFSTFFHFSHSDATVAAARYRLSLLSSSTCIASKHENNSKRESRDALNLLLNLPIFYHCWLYSQQLSASTRI